MWSTCSDRGARRGLAAALLTLSAAGCAHLSAPHHPRPALPLPGDVAARYALPGAVEEQLLVHVGGDETVDVLRGALVAGEERAEFHYLRPKHSTGPAPFVLCLPILAGGRDLMAFVAHSLAARGHAVAWTERVSSALKAPQRAHELEQLMRRTVIHNRMVLAWARRQAELDADRLGCVGISMGGMVGGLLLAVEPELAGGALCLAGGDLADMLVASTEPRARSWRRWRQEEDGLRGGGLREELGRSIVSDPALLGPYVATERVVLISGRFDSVVPCAHQDRLWESLGRPERHTLPVGHYTSALAFASIVDRVDVFLRRRFAAATTRHGLAE